MVLTEQGRDVLKHAVRISSELEEIRASASDVEAPLAGQVAIGLPPTVADIISVPLVAAFGKAHPNAVLRLVSAYTGYLMDWLHRGEIDLAVLYDPRTARSLRSRPLLFENLFLIGPPEAAFSTVRAVSFKDLTGKRLLLPSPRHGLRTIVERCASDAQITLDVAVEADSYATLKDLVRNGHGWTILPLAPIHESVVANALTAAPLIDPVPVRRLVLSFPADRQTPRLARFAGKAIVDIVADRVERAVWVGQLLDGKAGQQ
jgi:DNA-binding transcriptional LysR family regulator